MGRAKAGGERKGCSMDSIMATITQQKETIFRVFCCCQSDASLIANACYCKCICNNMHHRYGACNLYGFPFCHYPSIMSISLLWEQKRMISFSYYDTLKVLRYGDNDTLQEFPLTAHIYDEEDRIIFTGLSYSFSLHLYRTRLCSSLFSDGIHWVQQLHFKGSARQWTTWQEKLRTEYSSIYLVKLSLTAWFLMAALNFDGSIFTSIWIMVHRVSS